MRARAPKGALAPVLRAKETSEITKALPANGLIVNAQIRASHATPAKQVTGHGAKTDSAMTPGLRAKALMAPSALNASAMEEIVMTRAVKGRVVKDRAVKVHIVRGHAAIIQSAIIHLVHNEAVKM